MDEERALLTKVLEENAYQRLVRGGVKAQWFTDEPSRRLYYWITRFYERYGRCPSFVLTNQKFPAYQFEDTEDPLDALVEAVKDKSTYIELQRAIKDVAVAARESGQEGLRAFLEESAKLSTNYRGVVGINVADEVDRVMAEYEDNKAGRGLRGFPWPWEPMNEATRGICQADFHCLYGPPGSMKTWLLLVIAEFLTFKGIRPHLFTNEMLPTDILLRYSVLKAQIDYEKFQNGTLSVSEERHLRKVLEKMKTEPPFLIEQIRERGSAGLLEMKTRAQDSGAQVVLYDSFKFISKSPKYEDWYALIEGIREFTLTTTIPFIGTHHTSRQRQKGRQTRDNDADDVAWGETLQQLVTGLWRLNVTPQDAEDAQIQVTSRKTRERKGLTSFYVHAFVASNFGFKCKVDEDETPARDNGEGEYGLT